MENNNNKEVKEEIKQVKEDIKDVKDEKKDLKDNEMSQNNWSFSGLWGSATKVIQDNQNMQYLQTNLTSVRSAINELSEKVQTSPNTAYLNTTINKLGKFIMILFFILLKKVIF
ncbi:hypothetical protein K502DRAFT_331440 [Neoconidiobolus thromboides FSU 785]|nr:hypothetical protein K502DRAFT_331440 [Neoconidiobolus thromboides FSU 785]